MGVEIERKFLVASEGWRDHVSGAHGLVQGYLSRANAMSVRVRSYDDARAFITIKGREYGISRAEFEYEIPIADAREMLDLAEPFVVRKRRHLVPAGGHTWEIDVFEGRHKGLVLAEIELSSEDEHFARPDWLGAEVSGQERYYNSTLAGI